MKKIIILLIAVTVFASLSAQLHFSFSHYTSDNGLSQNSITAMFKDHKGYLWFATRDGLNRFDGYNFKNFNQQFSRKFSGISNRFIEIKEDKYGFIWLKAYDEMLYRFNTATEEFERLKLESGAELDAKISSFFILPSGDVWLKASHFGCYRVRYIESENRTTVKIYNTSLKNLPSNSVQKVFEDSFLNTWVLTTKGLVYIDNAGKHSFKFLNTAFYSFVEDDRRIILGSSDKLIQFDKKSMAFKIIEIPVNSKVIDIHSLNSNYYVVNVENNGFLTYNTLKNEIKQYTTQNFPQLKTNTIQQMYVDRAGDVWLGIKANGVLKFSVQANRIEFFPTAYTTEKTTNPNILFVEDDKDILWIQSYYGLFSWFDRKNNRLTPFNSLYNPDINTFLLYGVNHVLADEQGILWLSTNRGNGIFKCTFLPDYFNHILFDKNSVYNVSNEVRAIYEDRSKRLWVATKDGLVHVYDKNKVQIGTLDNSGRIFPGGNTDIYVYNFFQDKDGNIWLATKQKGLFRLKPAASANNFQVRNFLHNDNDVFSPASNDFYSITQDKLGRIWAGSYGGGLHLLQFSGEKLQFIHAASGLKNYPFANCSKVRQVYVDSKNRVWIATTEGIVTFDASEKNITNLNFIYYHNNENSPVGISANDIHFITEDTEKRIWVASFGGGLSMLKTTVIRDNKFEFVKYNRSGGLPANIIYTIIDDRQGNLWLTSENAIVKLNKQSKSIDVFGRGNEIENVEFSEAAACLLQSGEICVGSKSGMYAFKPLEVKRRIIDVPIVFTGLKVLNKDVEAGEESEFKKQIDFLDEIEFSHKQNVFTIEFAALDMRAPEKIQYAYMLDGFDREWNNVGPRQNATYTSLPPGKYVFRVKSTDSEGIWLRNERQITVRILPSFWQSVFAKILYVLFIIGLFVLALYIFVTIYKLKHNIQFEKQMTDMKLRFFTDISHELRTPLTLISLPVDNILRENIDPFVRDQMNLVRTNLDKVMSLINQILDFRKLQNNKMQLNIEEFNFGDFVTACSKNFLEMAHAKNLNIFIDNKSGDANVWADPERVESIIQNLISNAIKYSPAGKNIVVRTGLHNDMAVLQIIDEGVGIPQEKLSFIFERFFSNSTLKSILQKSTGIGLDLVKKMVELHHAEIEVNSQIGIGTTFTIRFKTGNLHFEDDMNITIFEKKKPIETVGNTEPSIEIESHETNNPLILVVEDNDELRHYLSMSLRSNYRVAEAANGKNAWAKIESIQPDIIIADLRMPEMDGMELTKLIREDNRTSHIPVILLTAVTDLDSKMEGLKIGADDYITKPFNSTFLLARIENLLAQRKKLQKYYRSQISEPNTAFELPVPENKVLENAFMKKLIKYMDDNIENFDLNIDMMASEFNMSRTIFFTKLKSLTGLSPVEFIREVRLQRAVEFMKTIDLPVSEVSYRVGIEDPRYFSRIFKLKFGETPTDYRHKFLNNNKNQE